MARLGDWRQDKDEELALDGIGGVNILVKADVHRSGMCLSFLVHNIELIFLKESTSHAMPSRTKPKLKASRRWLSERAMRSMAFPIMWSGISTRKRRAATHNHVLSPLCCVALHFPFYMHRGFLYRHINRNVLRRRERSSSIVRKPTRYTYHIIDGSPP